MPDNIDLSTMDSIPVRVGGYQRLRRHWVSPTCGFWDGIWSVTDAQAHWKAAEAGSLGEYERLYLKHFPKGSRVLEAGCGLGQIVVALRARGIEAEGLDYAESTIRALTARFPAVPFHLGDIRGLPFKDQSFDGLVSLGVIEHFCEGQHQILSEAARVLRKGGVLLVSVPFLNEYRLSKIRRGQYQTGTAMPFFEDCFTKQELTSLLSQAGFEVLGFKASNPVMTFVQESRLRWAYRVLEGTHYPRSIVDRVLRLFLREEVYGHMIVASAVRRR